MLGAVVILIVMICCDTGWIHILTEYSENYFIIDNAVCIKRSIISSLNSTLHFNGSFQYEIAGTKYENEGNLNCGVYRHFRGTYTCCKPGRTCRLFVKKDDNNVICPCFDRVYLIVKMIIFNLFTLLYCLMEYSEYLR